MKALMNKGIASYLPFLLLLYFALLLGLAPINLLSFDSYYYWEWSRHLALSYYDGSPMIAYFIKLTTWIWGDTLLALSLVGIISTAFTSFILYQTARLFLCQAASYIALALWLFSPLVTLDLLKLTSYDTPLTLFWSLTLYYTAQFIKTQQTKYLYLIGVSAGLLLLSKYSGVVLLLALFFFLLTSSYRALFKTRHFYYALCIAILIFSPVILWNAQHGWQSFLYQLNTHQLQDSVNPLLNLMMSFFTHFLVALNLMLIPGIVCWANKAYASKSPQDLTSSTIVRLCLIINTTFFLFYLLLATQANIRSTWLAPYLITSALLGGYCFQTFDFRRSIVFLISLYGIISLAILLNGTTRFSLSHSPKLIEYRLMKQFNHTYPQLKQAIISPGWFEARRLFFLKNQPAVYSIDCGSQQNQYALWSQDFLQAMQNKTLKSAVYIDTYDRIRCVSKYFDHCSKLPWNSITEKNKRYTLYAYQCTND